MSLERFERDGFCRFNGVLEARQVERVARLFDGMDRPGARLDATGLAPIVDLLTKAGSIGLIASQLLGAPAFVVRAILFDKQANSNWSLDWHQDRTIAVAEKAELANYGPWTMKQGLLHVQPPQSVIEAMVTLRVHVDDVPADNGPLRVLPGSHRLGRLSEREVGGLAEQTEQAVCLAAAGDVWAYRSAIVHASSAVSSGESRRRVLQLDFASEALDPPLRWAMTA